MDAFKVLARSTTLSKHHSQNTQPNRTPSSGRSSNPQLFNNTPAPAKAPEDGTRNGSKKRKRNDRELCETSVPPELDFFNNHAATSDKDIAVNSMRMEDGNKRQPENVAERVKADANTDRAKKLDESECRRILKQHKVRITKLWDPSSFGGRKKSSQRQDPLALESKKLKKRKLEVVPQPLLSFSHLQGQFGVPKKLAANVEDQGYTTPTEVQLGSLPLLLDQISSDSSSNRDDASHVGMTIDLLSVAPTGSGKTLAFLIPLITAISRNSRTTRPQKRKSHPMSIILAPTKELAAQTVNEGRKLTRNMGIKVARIRKGMRIATVDYGTTELSDDDLSGQSDASSEDTNFELDQARPTETSTKADILVSTPMALLRAITCGNGELVQLGTIQYLVLDEADVLLDPLFKDQTLQIWNACTSPRLRVSLWSATMGSSIEDLAVETIQDRWSRSGQPAYEAPILRLVVGLKDSAIPNVSHRLIYSATEQGKLMALRQILRPVSSANSTDGPTLRPPFLVFTQTIPRAVALHSELLYDISSEAGGAKRIAVLHADLSDTARERIMSRFRAGEIWVLVTTDLLSRGVDFRGINGVVNYDFPNSSAAYVHRAGRTGRAGRGGGVVVTLYAAEDIPFLKNVANVIAASERQRTGFGNGKDDQRMEPWLLDSLPKPSKRDKKRLKQRGVESRRPEKFGERSNAKTRISTKSGYERRLENRKKDPRQRKRPQAVGEVVDAEETNGDSDFEGFEG